MNTVITIAIIINERITSVEFQLARLAALSSATVVENVSPLIFSRLGAGVNKLTTTITTIENTNRNIQKYKKFNVANSYNNPPGAKWFCDNSSTSFVTPIIKPMTIAEKAPA